MSEADPPDVGATLRTIELTAKLRSIEVSVLHGLGLARGVDPDLSTAAVVVSAEEIADLRATCEEIAERADQLGTLAKAMSPGEIEVRLHTLQIEAEAALSAGVADIERVEVLVRCLPVRSGFQALAAMLRCTDCHESWTTATVGQVLGFFRGTDAHFVRRVTGMATLSPDTRWDECGREQIGQLAAVLEGHAATARCR